MVEFSSEAKEIYGGSAEVENFWGKPTKETEVAKLEPLPISDRESNVSSSKKNKSEGKKALWKNMVQKVKAKKSNTKNAESKNEEQSVLGEKVIYTENKTRSNRSTNLMPVSGARPFDRGIVSIQRQSFR